MGLGLSKVSPSPRGKCRLRGDTAVANAQASKLYPVEHNNCVKGCVNLIFVVPVGRRGESNWMKAPNSHNLNN